MKSRNQYIEAKIKDSNYWALGKKKKGEVLEEVAKITELNKNYLSNKMSSLQFESKADKALEKRKNRRKPIYDREVVLALKKTWEIFHKPCSQLLQVNLQSDTLDITLKDEKIQYPQRVIDLLRQISPKSIDNKLKEFKTKDMIKHKYENNKSDTLLKQTVKICLSNELDKTKPGSFSTDLVESCGTNAFGPFIQTFSSTDIFSGWWFGYPVIRAVQTETIKCLELRNKLCPFPIVADYTDNGSPLLNWLTKKWYDKNGIEYTRSRPNKKNDNCFVEQKNYTHVRKYTGYLRFDTKEELWILNELYMALMDFRNFFLPTFKLTSKIRDGAKIHKQYGDIRTPFHRLIASLDVSEGIKKNLIRYRKGLHPVELSRRITTLQRKLYKVHLAKYGKNIDKTAEIYADQNIISHRFLTPRQRSFCLED